MTQSEIDWINSELKSINEKLDYNKVLAERVRDLEKSKWKFGGIIIGISSAFSFIFGTIAFYLNMKA